MALSTYFREANKAPVGVGNFLGVYRYTYHYEYGQKGEYFCTMLDPFFVKTKIEERKDNKQEFIGGKDPKTGKNAFHAFLGDIDLFSSNKDWQSEYHYYISASEAYKPDGTRRTDVVGYYDQATYERYNQKPVDHRSLAEFQKLAEAKKITMLSAEGVRALKLQHAKEIFTLLVEPYSGKESNEALTQVLLAEDKQRKKAIFCLFDYHAKNSLNEHALLERIKTLDLEQRKRLLSARNSSGKTIAHVIASRFDLNSWKIVFGENAIKQVLSLPDNDTNTPLHDVFLNEKAPEQVKSICDLLSAAPVSAQPHHNDNDEKKNENTPSEEPPSYSASVNEDKSQNVSLFASQAVSNVFCQNSKGLNPIHMLCQRASSLENVNMLNNMLRVLSKEQFVAKIKQKTRVDGCTPLHYAIQTNNVKLVEEMLEKLTSDQKKQFADITTNKEETILHYACKYSDNHMQKLVADALGPTKVYEIRRQQKATAWLPSTKKVFKKKDELKGSNRLFDCLTYLVDNHSQSADYIKRINDFAACLNMIRECIASGAKIALPDEDPSFFAKTHLRFFSGSARYHKRRQRLDDITREELEAFDKYIQNLAGDDSASEEKDTASVSCQSGKNEVSRSASVDRTEVVVAKRIIALEKDIVTARQTAPLLSVNPLSS